MEFKDINHYYSYKLFTYLGKDKHFPGFNGKLAHVSFVSGDGAFRKSTDYNHPLDVFRFEKGQATLLPKIDVTKPKIEDKKA